MLRDPFSNRSNSHWYLAYASDKEIFPRNGQEKWRWFFQGPNNASPVLVDTFHSFMSKDSLIGKCASTECLIRTEHYQPRTILYYNVHTDHRTAAMYILHHSRHKFEDGKKNSGRETDKYCVHVQQCILHALCSTWIRSRRLRRRLRTWTVVEITLL